LRSSAACVAVETGLLASEVLSTLPSPTWAFVTECGLPVLPVCVASDVETVAAAPAASKAVAAWVAAVPRPRLVRAVPALARSERLFAASSPPADPPASILPLGSTLAAPPALRLPVNLQVPPLYCHETGGRASGNRLSETARLPPVARIEADEPDVASP
jgi:hypothetical protein